MKENLHEIQQSARSAALSVLAKGFEPFVNEVVSHTVHSYLITFDEELQPTNLRAWASKVARHKAANIMRTEKRLAKLVVCNSELADSVSDLNECCEFMTPALLLSHKEHVEAVVRLLKYTEDAVDALESADRDLYRLVFKERMTFDEAASLMGQKPNTLVKRFPLLLKKVTSQVHLLLSGDELCAEVFGVIKLSAEEWRPIFVQLLKDIRAVA